MRTFKQIYAMAAKLKGGEKALEALLPTPKTPAQLAKIPDDRWLSQATQCVFNAGFNWKVIENKWPGFEEAFAGFKPKRWAVMSDDDFDALLKDTRIVRNAAKIRAVAGNAQLMLDLAKEHGSAAKFFAHWPSDDLIGLYEIMKTRGDRLGGNTGQMFIRFMGKDSFVFSQDVNAALIREGVIDKPATSKAALRAAQDAFNAWAKESGRPLMHISRTLAASVG
jgi:3-methyladenine DNA glycosylase Tag